MINSNWEIDVRVMDLSISLVCRCGFYMDNSVDNNCKLPHLGGVLEIASGIEETSAMNFKFIRGLFPCP
jgi:hypothetical protein